jgi:hypothetical protein
MKKSFWRVVLLILLSLPCIGQKLILQVAKPELIEQRLASGLVKPKERQAAIRKLFEVEKKTANVICTLVGETVSTIAVGGHFDFVDRGRGMVDDWSGVSLLPSLYEAMKGKQRRHTYVFVAFAAEERGLIGSKHYVKNLSEEQRANLRAFVNLECLGLSPVKVWTSRSDPKLVNRLIEVAKAVDIQIRGVDVEKVGNDDTQSFVTAKVPVLSIHSITQETLPILHTVKDQLKAVQINHYYGAYRLVAFYLAYLDLKLVPV